MDQSDNYWTRMRARRVSRRSVLRGTLGIASLAAVGGLAACTDNTVTPTAAPAPTTAAVAATAPATARPAVSPTAIGATTVGGKQIQYARFLANPTDFTGTPKAGGTLNIGTQYTPANFNATNLGTVTIGQFLGPVYNRLIRGKFGVEMNPYDPFKFEPAGELAESWTLSPDGTEYTFKIRQGVKFQNKAPVNGREFVADDAKWSLENNKTDIWDTLKGAGAVVTTPDKYTLKIAVKNKVSWMIPLLADPRMYMVPKEVADMPGGFNDNMIGTGPFILSEYIPRTSATYVKNPDYFEKGKPYLDKMVLQIILDPVAQRTAARGGQLQMVQGDGLTPQEVDGFIRGAPDMTVFERDSTSGAAIYHLSMRVDKAPFNDVRVRRALSMGFNRKAMSDAIWAGKATTLLPFAWQFAYDSFPDLGPYYKYDPEGAKALLAQAGVQPGTTWQMLIGKYGPNVEPWVQLMQADFKKIGIELDLKSPDLATFAAQFRPVGQKPAYEHLATGIVFTNPVDPALSMITNLRSDAVINTDQINDPKLDTLLNTLAAEPDTQKQRPLLAKVWEYIADQAYWPAIPEGPALSYYHKSVQNFLSNYRNNHLDWGMPQTREIWLKS